MRRTGIVLSIAALLLLSAAPSQGQTPSPAPPRPAVLLVNASATLTDAVIAQKIDRTEPFMEVIKEIPNYGTRRTVGSVHAVLVPDPTQGVVEIVFQGTSYAKAVGYRRITRTWSETVTTVESTYRVSFDARGLCGTRASAGASACISLLDVVDNTGDRESTPANVVRLGFPREKAELESIVSHRTRTRASLEQEAEITPRLANAGETLGLAWAKRLGLNVAALEFATTAEYLEARLPAQPAPTGWTAPPALPANADFSVRVHQSLLNDVARAGLGGRTFKLGELEGAAEQLLAPLLRDGRQAKEREASMAALAKLLRGLTGKPASLALAQDDPIRFTFADHGLTVVAHISRIQFDDRTLPGVKLKGVYRLVNTSTGVELKRQGPLEIIPDQAPAKGDAIVAAAVRTALGLLGTEILRDRFVVVNLARPEAVVASHADTASGWLSVAWQLQRRSR